MFSLSRKPFYLIFFGIIIIIALSTIIIFRFPYANTINDDWAKLSFDVKLLRLNTNIVVSKNDDKIGTIEGKIVKVVTDPLTFYDNNGNIVGYAGDQYNFIAQDSHLITVNGEVTANMVGKHSFIGEKYEIYDRYGLRVGTLTIDGTRLNGKLTNNSGDILAVFRSTLVNDFYVYISPDCQFDDITVSLMFSSYYSDDQADSKDSDNNSSSDD